jgi:hypothetical protein
VCPQVDLDGSRLEEPRDVEVLQGLEGARSPPVERLLSASLDFRVVVDVHVIPPAEGARVDRSSLQKNVMNQEVQRQRQGKTEEKTSDDDKLAECT